MVNRPRSTVGFEGSSTLVAQYPGGTMREAVQLDLSQRQSGQTLRHSNPPLAATGSTTDGPFEPLRPVTMSRRIVLYHAAEERGNMGPDWIPYGFQSGRVEGTE